MAFKVISAACLLQLCCLTAVDGAAKCSQPSLYNKQCNATAFNGTRRIRREVMDLSAEEWQRVVDAMWTMRTTSMAEGQRRFGTHFKTYDYFLFKHAVSTSDSRGDQAHNTEAFTTFHAAIVLEFENAVLAVDPRIEGIPYWSSYNGEAFTATHFGSAPGTGEGNTVIDGKFAGWQVPSNFSIADWSGYLQDVPGARTSFVGNPHGFFRDDFNDLQTAVVTRFGKSFVFPEENFTGCVATTACFKDWYKCIDCYDPDCRFGNLHGQAHPSIGGDVHEVGLRPLLGDFTDSGTSPNDPIFFFHHANTERSRMAWMEAHKDELEVYYGYGGNADLTAGHGPAAHPGIDLGDVISALFPFTSEQLGLVGPTSDGLTHADILCWLGPDSAPYEYAPPRGGAATQAAQAPHRRLGGSLRGGRSTPN